MGVVLQQIADFSKIYKSIYLKWYYFYYNNRIDIKINIVKEIFRTNNILLCKSTIWCKKYSHFIKI